MPASPSFTLTARFTSRASVVSSISCANLSIAWSSYLRPFYDTFHLGSLYRSQLLPEPHRHVSLPWLHLCPFCCPDFFRHPGIESLHCAPSFSFEIPEQMTQRAQVFEL